jgi:hypothetical protein
MEGISPSELHHKWPDIAGQLQLWCEQQKIPLSFVSDASLELGPDSR